MGKYQSVIEKIESEMTERIKDLVRSKGVVLIGKPEGIKLNSDLLTVEDFDVFTNSLYDTAIGFRVYRGDSDVFMDVCAVRLVDDDLEYMFEDEYEGRYFKKLGKETDHHILTHHLAYIADFLSESIVTVELEE